MFEQIQDSIAYLEQHFQDQSLSDDQLFQATELYALELNDTDESLQRLEIFLNRLRDQKTSIETLSQEQKGQYFLLFCAHYLCRCICQRTRKTVIWHNNSHNLTPSQITFVSDTAEQHPIAIIDQKIIPAFTIIHQYLYGQNTISLTDFVENYCEQLTQLTTSQTHIIYQHYIDALRHNQYLPNGNAYGHLTQLIQFDGSLRSVDEIDCLIQSIKDIGGLASDQLDSFVADSKKLNLAIALGFYLGHIISLHGRVGLKWMNQQEYQTLSSSQTINNTQLYVASTDKYVIQPIQHVLNCLFSENHEKTCREFVQGWISMTQGALYIFPSNLRIEQHEKLLPQIEDAFKHAGYFVARLTQQIKNTQLLSPVIYTETMQNQFDLFEDHSEIRQRITPDQSFWLSAQPSTIDLPNQRLQSIQLEIHIQHPITFLIRLQLPFSLDESQHLTIYSIIRDQHNDLTLHEMQAGIAKLYQEAFRYADPETQHSLWGKHFKEYAWEKVNTAQASPEQIFELKKQLKIKLTEHNIPEFTNNHFEQQATSQQNEIENSPPNTIDPTTTIEPLAVAASTEPPITKTKLQLNIPKNLNPFAKIDLQKEIEHLPSNYLSYLQVLPPVWLQQDTLHKQIKAIPTLYHTGKVIWGSPIASLTTGDINENSVVHFVYDPTGQSSAEILAQAAQDLDQIQHLTDLPDDQKLYLEAIQQSEVRFENFAYPLSLNQSNLLISSSWIWPSHLPDGKFSLASCPIIITDNRLYSGVVMLLPSWFWPKNLRQDWLNISAELTGEDQDLSPVIFKNLELFQLIRPDLDPLALQPNLSALVDQTGSDFNLDMDTLLLEKNQPRQMSLSPLTQKILIGIGILIFIGIMML